LSASLDDRDFIISPSSGYLVSQNLAFTGGFLFGSRHFIRTDTRLEGYVTFVDVPVFPSWNFKIVGAAQSSLSLLLPQFVVPRSADRFDEWGSPGNRQVIAQPNDRLIIDGMTNARGWEIGQAGEALWSNWLEVRMPIAEQFVWFDTFFDAATLYQEPFGEEGFGGMGIEDFYFSFGAGIRFTIPQFPIRLYLAKRFQIEDGRLQWQPGDLFRGDSPTGGIDFVFALTRSF
jgi:outer membrane protein insertion porin family